MGMAYGLGKVGEGLSSGMTSGMQTLIQLKKMDRDEELKRRALDLQERHYGILEKQSEAQQAAQKVQMQQHFVKTIGELADMTPDPDLHKIVNLYNESAPMVGLPPNMTGIKRTAKGTYHIQDVNGKLWGINTSTLKALPITEPGTGETAGPQLQKTETPEEKVKKVKANMQLDAATGIELEPNAAMALGIPIPEDAKGPKVSDIGSALKSIYGKYGINAGELYKPDGTINMEALAKSKGSVYEEMIKRANNKEDPLAAEASGDLDRVRQLHGLLDTAMGLQTKAATPATAATGVAGAGAGATGPGKSVKRTGTYNGRKVVEYDDGTVTYAD